MVRRARVVGGVVSLIHMFPFIAEIIYQPQNSPPHHACGGSLLSYSWVLTAAHCHMSKKNYITYFIGAGYLDGTFQYHKNGSFYIKDGEIRKAILFLPHENFTSAKGYDVALYKTKYPFPRDNFRISPVNLPATENSGDVSDIYKACYFAGWGRTSPNYSLEFKRDGGGSWEMIRPHEADATRKLIHVILPPISLEACRNIRDAWRGIDFADVTPEQLCTLYYPGRKCICSGDSGSPLICGSRQFGIASAVYSCGTARIGVDVFTRVDKHLKWISEKINETSRKFNYKNRFKDVEYLVEDENVTEYYGLLYHEMIMDHIESGDGMFGPDAAFSACLLTFVHCGLIKILAYFP